MRILVIGQGGREHAIAKALLMDPKVEQVYCCPGNAGMMRDGILTEPIAVTQIEALSRFAAKQNITYTIVGPEQPLSLGIVDYFTARKQAIFGPTQQAAQLESSKSYAKAIMEELSIPTASYAVFTDEQVASDYIAKQSLPIVLKADGLASGKGVFIVHTQEEAQEVLTRLFAKANTVVVEAFLEGEEFTLMAFVANETVYPMVLAQDHKQAYDHDEGPNTGGMGAYAPLPQFDASYTDEVVDRVLNPVVQHLAKQGTPFTGILYAGMMATQQGIQVIEFNVRFGDPEAQVVLPLLESSLAQIIFDLLQERTPNIRFSTKTSLGVVVARSEYPEAPTPKAVFTPLQAMQSHVYFSNLIEEQEQYHTDGGRIFVAQALADSLAEARDLVYSDLSEYNWTNLRYRRDIGTRFSKNRTLAE